jgi:hypothetical protein
MFRLALLLLLFLTGFLTGCLPIPDLRLDFELPEPEYRLAPEHVEVAYVSLPGYPEPHTPEPYNRATFLRYYAQPQPAGTVVVLMPGLSGGAASLDIYARQLVATAADVEVWVVDRRANLLEDRAVFLESVRAGDPLLAYDYYVEKAGEEGGFVPLAPEDVPFMARWGLEVHLRDLHAVVRRAGERAHTVILGGHSLGAGIVSLYAAFDFGGAGSADPGYRAIDGLILIDGVLGRTGAYALTNPSLSFGPFTLIPSLEAVKAGDASPLFTLVRDPAQYARQEVAALLALYEPRALSPGGFFDFPITNRAVAGLLIDDHYAPSTVFSASVGRATNAEVAGNLLAVLLGGQEGIYSQSVVGVAPGYDYVDWERGDPQRERTDLTSVLKAWAMPQANFTEWYFPLRLLLDMSELGVRLNNAPGFVPNDTVPTPTLAVGASRGLVTSLDGFSAYINARPAASFSAHILPGLTHYDIVMAEHNPLVPLSALWLERLR